jgi:hypothetical protein
MTATRKVQRYKIKMDKNHNKITIITKVSILNSTNLINRNIILSTQCTIDKMIHAIANTTTFSAQFQHDITLVLCTFKQWFLNGIVDRTTTATEVYDLQRNHLHVY